jgi:outer membrane beta-barrel protein
VKRSTTAALALCLWPLLSWGQSSGSPQQVPEGLDLSQPEPKKEEEAPAAAQPEDTPASQVEAIPTVDAPTVGAQAIGEAEREVTQEDRVKSVQRKVYLKKGRFELAPFVTTSINDPFYAKYGASLRLGYYLADTVAIAARGSLLRTAGNDDVRTAKQAFDAQIFRSAPRWSAMGDLEWSPLYGKSAFMNSILHFDAYLLGGLGVMNTETSQNVPGREGLRPAADLGVGMRFVAKDFLAVNVAIINTSYTDQPLGTTKGSLQNLMTLNAGISLFFPFSSTGREAE